MTDPNTGRKIADRYELIETIGQGSMGKVYLAGDSLLGDVPVAVKFLSQTLLNEGMRERFLREAMTCAQLGQKSMHVVRVTDYGLTEDDIPFYVMEYLQGDNIGQIVRKQKLPVPRFLSLTRQILLGLRTAHNGILVKGEVVPIIHRDIKPSNILVTADPSIGELVKILDFGIAKLMQAGSEQTSTFMGTLAYASPEQMEGRELDGRSDIYSLGVMMYQMLSGKLPVKPKNNTFGSWYKVHRLAKPIELTKRGIPKALSDVVMNCLAKQREDRPPSIDAILDAIDPIEEQLNGGHTETGHPNRPSDNSPSAQNRADQNRKNQNRERLEDLSDLSDLSGLLSESANVGRIAQQQRQSPTGTQSNLVATKSSMATEDLVVSEDSESNNIRSQPVESFYLEQSWPPEMPIAQIVFPKLLSKPSSQISEKTENVPALWAMMPMSEIEKRSHNTCYNNFLCTMAPHPTVLWLTAFYNKTDGPRWLPCYLDLKAPISLSILMELANAQQYQILFFSKEAPHKCVHAKTLNIASSQIRLLKEWAIKARSFPSNGDLQGSKKLLKRELENTLKPKIMNNFDSMHAHTQSNARALSALLR